MRGTVVVGGGGAATCHTPVTASSFNLAPDGSCGATLPGDPLLGPFADNGGPTATHLPGAGSGAIDAVPVGTVGLCDGSVATDQRGVEHTPVGTACDVGAVERSAPRPNALGGTPLTSGPQHHAFSRRLAGRR